MTIQKNKPIWMCQYFEMAAKLRGLKQKYLCWVNGINQQNLGAMLKFFNIAMLLISKYFPNN